MKITITGPTFYDSEDENVFFNCIYSLPSYEQVRGHAMSLDIEFKAEPNDQDIVQLLVICRRWHIDIEPIKKYKRASNKDCVLWENQIQVAST